jgi:hypothetical protein
MIDAPPSGGTPDAPPTATCIPACFVSTVTSLTAGCLPSGTCTTHTDLGTLTTTICYSNGVKVVSMLSGSSFTSTYKNASGVCYSTAASAPTGTSAQILYKNAAGTTVVEIDVPDTGMPNKQTYTCEGGAPIMVDTNSPACQAVLPDAGTGPDGGSSCTQDAACVP